MEETTHIRLFRRLTGVALALGGTLTVLINVILSSQLPEHASMAVTATTNLFLWRQSASAVAAVLLLFGVVGLYLWQINRAGRFGAIAFVLAFIGTALTLSVEWSEVFLVRELAFRAPDALRALDSSHGMNRYDMGALTALGLFEIGWIALAISTWRTHMSRRAASLVIAGFILIPVLGAVLHLWGAIAGNVILGAGWIWLGVDMQHERTPV